MQDPDATTPISIRCVCPPKDEAVRHPDGDTVGVRTQYSYGDELQLSKQSVRYQTAVIKDKPMILPYTDAFLKEEAMLEIGIKDWTILNAEDQPVPVALSSILLLPPDVGSLLSVTINDLWEKSKASVPNGSGAPSLVSTAENSDARPNRATRRSRKHSTQN